MFLKSSESFTLHTTETVMAAIESSDNKRFPQLTLETLPADSQALAKEILAISSIGFSPEKSKTCWTTFVLTPHSQSDLTNSQY
jgi:hypothetical protein